MKIQDSFLILGNYGCLYLDYCYCLGVSADEAVKALPELVEKNIVSDECYINNPSTLANFFGKKMTVEKTTEEPEGNEKYIASYEYNGKTHFAVKQNKKIIYNTLENSFCVKYGKEKDYRILNF